ncbi:MAG: LysR family transcriptional regulator [Rhodopseudomonas sp.]|nr:LysR family transcriptional regulator [Rhodopseudomonas sp.]
MNITIRQLQAFIEVADAASFTQAAKRMHIAQPALSQHVRDLESELGIRLFDRTTRRVELTEGGREFRNRAGKIVEDLEHATRYVHDYAERKHGRVTIAAPPLLAATILPWAMADFHAAFPGIQISLTELPSDQIVAQVRSGKIECALGTFRAGEPDISSKVLCSDSLAAFSLGNNPLSRQKRILWRELENYQLIAMTRESNIRLLFELGCERSKAALNPTYEVSHVTTALAMVEAGLGVAILPTYAAVASRNPDVKATPLHKPQMERNIVLITQSGRSPSPGLQSFTHFLVKHTLASLPRSLTATGRKLSARAN